MMKDKWTVKRVVVEVLTLVAAWLIGVFLYISISRDIGNIGDTRPLTPLEWIGTVVVFGAAWVVLTMLRSRKSRASDKRNRN